MFHFYNERFLRSNNCKALLALHTFLFIDYREFNVINIKLSKRMEQNLQIFAIEEYDAIMLFK